MLYLLLLVVTSCVLMTGCHGNSQVLESSSRQDGGKDEQVEADERVGRSVSEESAPQQHLPSADLTSEQRMKRDVSNPHVRMQLAKRGDWAKTNVHMWGKRHTRTHTRTHARAPARDQTSTWVGAIRHNSHFYSVTVLLAGQTTQHGSWRSSAGRSGKEGLVGQDQREDVGEERLWRGWWRLRGELLLAGACRRRWSQVGEASIAWSVLCQRARGAWLGEERLGEKQHAYLGLTFYYSIRCYC